MHSSNYVEYKYVTWAYKRTLCIIYLKSYKIGRNEDHSKTYKLKIKVFESIIKGKGKVIYMINKIKKNVKRITCLIVMLIFINTSIAKNDTPILKNNNTVVYVKAASTRKCHLIGTSNETGYSDKTLTQEYGTIFPSDELIVHTVTSSYSKVTWPVQNGKTKTGYIKTSAILLATEGETRYTIKDTTTYQHYTGSPSYGTTTVGDTCIVLGTYGDYTQIKYNVKGGYKYAFIKTSDANNNLSKTKNGGNNESYSISGNILTVNGVAMTEYLIGSKYTSKRFANVNGKSVDMFGWQCCGYARYIDSKLYGCHDKNAPSKFKNVAGKIEAGNLTTKKLKSAVLEAGIGSHFRTQGKSHSMVIIDTSDNGFTVTDANYDGKNTIRVKNYTWASYMCSTYGKRGILYIKKYVG